MKKLMALAIGCSILMTLSFKNSNTSGECDLSKFMELRGVQEAEKIDKEDEVLGLGYSFEKEEERGGYNLRYYGKCEKSYGYNERITFNVTNNSIGYGTYSRENYLSIKDQVKEIPACKREKDGEFDVFEFCSDGHAYLFSVGEVQGKGYYYVDIQN